MNRTDIVTLILALAHMMIVIVATVYISANRRPSAAIAWVLAIVFIPYLGALAFLFVGVGKLPESRRHKQRQVNALMLARTPGLAQVSHREEWPAWLPSAAQLNLNLGALPMVGGNQAELFPDYQGSIDAMTLEIDTSTEFVHVQFYILVLDDVTAAFFNALRRAVARGVRVRVLSDFLACRLLPRHAETVAALADMGAEWHALLPLRPLHGQWQRPDLRNHRKLLIVDGRVGFTGSQNMIDSTYLKPKNLARGLHWHELVVRVHGPVVRELNAVFVVDWYSETDEHLPLDHSPIVLGAEPHLLDAQVVPSGPSFDNDNNLALYAMLIQNARYRVSITSPYFVPEESTLLAITTAALRGVAVELFVSEIGDQALVYYAQRSYYEALLRAGVRIYLYAAPTVLHSKHFSIDDDVAVIGSSNMDIRSFSLNMEVSLLVQGTDFVRRMREIEDDYRANSAPLNLQDWLTRPTGKKVRDNLARLTSSLQ